MNLKTIISILVISTIFSASGCAQDVISDLAEKSDVFSTKENDWKETAEGLSYKYIHINPDNGDDLKDYFAVRVDPKTFEFEVYQNRDQESAMTIREIHKSTGSLLSFNGGFFTEDFKPTGLLISKGEKIRVTSPASLLNGIFAVEESGAVKLFSNNATINENKYPFAIQNGPVLIDEDGQIKISEETGKAASRTAIGIDNENNIVLIILKQSLFDPDNHITLYEFARALKESPGFKELNLHSVLNLDGGASTGLMVDDQYFPELDRVQNVVIVKPRQQQ